jgi:CRISPR/Cas system-associated exonuclease Cas4 (RecB family)
MSREWRAEMPKPKMPDGPYVSVSQIKTWLLCPRRYELRYIRGIAPAFVPVNLAFGSAFHEALAGYYNEIKVTGVPLRRDLVLDTFRAAWARAAEGDVSLQADEDDADPGVMIDKGVSMLHAFYEQAGTPIVEAVEHGFTITLHDVDTGEPLEEQLVGTMDLLIREEGRVVVVEHKTAARKYTADQLAFDLQLTAYQIAARESGLGEVALRFQVVTKTKVPAVQVVDILRDDQAEADFVRTATGVLKAIDSGVSYPVRGWQCRGCPYESPCSQPARSKVKSAA